MRPWSGDSGGWGPGAPCAQDCSLIRPRVGAQPREAVGAERQGPSAGTVIAALGHVLRPARRLCCAGPGAGKWGGALEDAAPCVPWSPVDAAVSARAVGRPRSVRRGIQAPASLQA